MDTQKQVIDRLKQANNVLVTVSNNPSVDQLAACIGLSLALNKLDKHATAVFSGNVPSTIEFLQPEDTIEKNTDSLRDFIISLDKSKADKLRYKVEDRLVRIFITPYRTSISDADLEFSQGDFNVDVVLAIGVHDQKELDQAVTAHGRILHDATVITLNNQEQGGELGSIHWLDTTTSSLSEMSAALAIALSQDVLDQQIATAFLTGVVAETDRFSNEKTTAETMNVSASLMAAGANQQLVATKLQEPEKPQSQSEPAVADEPKEQPADAHVNEDGTLEINHDNDEKPLTKDDQEEKQPPAEEQAVQSDSDKTASQQESTQSTPQPDEPKLSPATPTETLIEEPQRYKNPRTAVSPPPFSSDTDPNLANEKEKYVDPLTLPSVDTSETSLPDTALPQSASKDRSYDTLSDIEQEVNSPHLHAKAEPPQAPPAWQSPKPQNAAAPEELNLDDLQRPEGIDEQHESEPASVDAARDAVEAAMSDAAGPSAKLEPIAALNAQPLGGPLHTQPQDNPPVSTSTPGSDGTMQLPTPPTASGPPAGPDPTTLPTADQPMTMPLPGTPVPQQQQPQDNSDQQPPNAAPPVPPPIVPPFPQ